MSNKLHHEVASWAFATSEWSFVATGIVTSSSSTMTASGLCAGPIMERGILSIRRWPIPATLRRDNGPVSYCAVASSRWFGKVRSEGRYQRPSLRRQSEFRSYVPYRHRLGVTRHCNPYGDSVSALVLKEHLRLESVSGLQPSSCWMLKC
jgi:hypothetical protein